MIKLMRGLHFFIGIGAVFGGLGAVLNPEAPMGISTDTLKLGPFETFLIPGLFLLIVLGMGNLATGWLLRYPWKVRGFISGTFAVIMVLWIVIQCVILQSVNALHVLFFLIGLLQGVLALGCLWRDGVIPSK